jgi:hypothetical protein
MQFYKTKAGKLPGTNYKEVHKHARDIFNQVKKRTKRKPYIRSAYFNKDKVFFENFWVHLAQKIPPERYRRLKYFAAALEVLRNSKHSPESIENRHNSNEILHRFGGITDNNEKFYVQVKEYKRTNRKQLMSVFKA